MHRPTSKAKIVRVRTEEGETGLFYATSPDLPGLLVAEPTMDALEDAIPLAIADLYRASGIGVVVSKVESEEDGLRPWVAFPAEIARAALNTN
ncbi:MAG: hypothetical protein QNJ30_00510 [Kiloniellales bacterium]|nr:hypothetical protein [Kiloniellales bacterium]